MAPALGRDVDAAARSVGAGGRVTFAGLERAELYAALVCR
jgi:hypothetical protein